MKVIGAGLPRTATLTQKLALERLGFAPCYHMVDVLADLGRVQLWRQALEGSPDWDVIFPGYQATVDWPGAFFYQELLEAYPDAKVLLSVRDPGAWEHSMGETIWGIFYGDLLIRDLSNARAKVDEPWASYMSLMKDMWAKSGLLGNEDEGPGAGRMAEAMERYNAEVKAAVPPGRLLVWSPADGWGPLCEFVGAPVPAEPLPHVNDSKSFGTMIVDASLRVLGAWHNGQQRVATATRT
jgi:hypothetical protein